VMSSPLAANSVGPRTLEVSDLADKDPHVIQAKLELRSEASVPVGARSVVSGSVARRSVVARMNKPVVIPAQAGPPRVEDPMPVRSAVTAQAAAPRTLILVMRTEFVQTRQSETSGAVVWNLSVWRITVIGPIQNRTAESIAKSI
jgi:hypothetical protein